MTEKEREELIEKMAQVIARADHKLSGYAAMARAALAVAEPVIREQAENALREENARLREAVKAAYYEGWTDNSSREYALQEINNDWETSEACATIREGQDNE